MIRPLQPPKVLGLQGEVGGSPEVRSSRPAWSRWRNPVSTKNTKISWVWWQTPVIPATLGRLRQESRLNPGDGDCNFLSWHNVGDDCWKRSKFLSTDTSLIAEYREVVNFSLKAYVKHTTVTTVLTA
ncbi:putative uncharacterized protein C8orf44 [Plecturocebus cupreus]